MKKRFFPCILVLVLLGFVGVVAANFAVKRAEAIGDYALDQPETTLGRLSAKLYQRAAPMRWRQLDQSLEATVREIEAMKDQTTARPTVLLDPEWIKGMADLQITYGKKWAEMDGLSRQMKRVERRFEE